MYMYLVFTLISKYFRFSGRHIGFLECVKYGLKAPSCSQFIFRKSRQGASFNSKRFGNGSKKSGLGGDFTPPPFTIRGLSQRQLIKASSGGSKGGGGAVGATAPPTLGWGVFFFLGGFFCFFGGGFFFCGGECL